MHPGTRDRPGFPPPWDDHRMHPPPTEPSDRPNPTHGSGSSVRRDIPEPSLSDLLRGSSAKRRNPSAEVASHLAGGPARLPDTDDAPTVITNPNNPSPPPPPYVVGEGGSVAGRKLGHFELIEAVGAGGMAAVLKARDLELGRVVALKILPPESAKDTETVTRFKQEARAAAKLDHENVARVYFCGEDQGLHFIAFEFVEGITLRQMIDRRGPLPAGECVRYMIQIAAGLNHAAERGVVHRDIKPSNILITPDGRAKIVDMGLARHLDSASVNGGVTQSGVTLGTFDYISPEQALDPRRADVRSDLYSMGCAFYHALAGRPPVPEGTAAKKLQFHQHVAPLDPRELNPAVPDDLAAVLARLMAKNPDRRYQSPLDLIAHLKTIADRLRVGVESAVKDSAVLAVAARQLPAGPRVRLGWVAAAAAVAAAAVMLASAGNGGRPGPPPPPWADPGPTPPPAEPALPGPAPAPAPPADGWVRVKTAAELADALATSPADGELRVKLAAGEYDLTELGRPVAFTGTLLKLAPGEAGAVRVKLAPHHNRDAPGGLTVRAAKVVIQRVRFEFAVAEADDAAPGEPAGVVLAGAADVKLEDCQFYPDPAARKSGRAAVTVLGGDGPVRVKLDRCLVAPGGYAVRVPAGSAVEVADSGFAPLAAAVQVRADGDEIAPPTTIDLLRSSFMADAVEASGGGVQVRAGYCVFAPAAPGAVVRTPADTPAGLSFAGIDGKANAYYHADPLAAAGRAFTFDECKAMALPADDPARVALKQRPWAAGGDVLDPLLTADPHRTFRLRVAGPDADADLFTKDAAVRVLGAQFLRDPRTPPGLAYSGAPAVPWPPVNPAADPAGPRVLVWWPDAPKDAPLSAGVSTDLVKLLRDARSGDTIQIRHTGPLPVEEVVVNPGRAATPAERADFHITVTAEKDSAPVLTPAAVNQLDFSFFRVREGRLTLDGLEFQLKPGPDNDAVSAVTLVAGRELRFKNCVFTLDDAEPRTATVVTVADPGREMAMSPAARPPPKVEFDGCLVRGRGRLLAVPASRAFELDLDQCLTALAGPLVWAKAGGRDPGAGPTSAVRLHRVTAFLGGPVVELHGGRVGEMRASGLVPTVVTAGESLFVGVPGAGRPMAEVDGTDLDRTDPNRVLRWVTGRGANRFANFEPAAPTLVVRPGDAPVREWDWDRWLEFAGELGRPVGTVTFADAPDAPGDLGGMTPADAVIRGVTFPDLSAARPADAGVDPEKVARPAGR
jgi:hypothetical protein